MLSTSKSYMLPSRNTPSCKKCVISQSISYVNTLQKQSPEVFCKKVALRNFSKFTGKHLYQSLFFNNLTLLKKRLRHRCFPVNFEKFLRTDFLTEHLRWLLLTKCTNVPSKAVTCSTVKSLGVNSHVNVIRKNIANVVIDSVIARVSPRPSSSFEPSDFAPQCYSDTLKRPK